MSVGGVKLAAGQQRRARLGRSPAPGRSAPFATPGAQRVPGAIHVDPGLRSNPQSAQKPSNCLRSRPLVIPTRTSWRRDRWKGPRSLHSGRHEAPAKAGRSPAPYGVVRVCGGLVKKALWRTSCFEMQPRLARWRTSARSTKEFTCRTVYRQAAPRCAIVRIDLSGSHPHLAVC